MRPPAPEQKTGTSASEKDATAANSRRRGQVRTTTYSAHPALSATLARDKKIRALGVQFSPAWLCMWVSRRPVAAADPRALPAVQIRQLFAAHDDRYEHRG